MANPNQPRFQFTPSHWVLFNCQTFLVIFFPDGYKQLLHTFFLYIPVKERNWFRKGDIPSLNLAANINLREGKEQTCQLKVAFMQLLEKMYHILGKIDLTIIHIFSLNTTSNQPMQKPFHQVLVNATKNKFMS